MLFIRDFMGFTGGHLKVFDFFNHVRSSGLFAPQIYMTASSKLDETNPWVANNIPLLREPTMNDSYFLGGLDWEILDRAKIDTNDRLIINLIAHPRHADPAGPRFKYLSRRALRICVSREVADAISATGIVNGEIVIIPNCIDLAITRPLKSIPKTRAIFIGGLKNRQLAENIYQRLVGRGFDVDLSCEPIPRQQFLARMAAANIAVLLPNTSEGFFLPALEAMAVGSAVVVPDCLGNRCFCINQENCVVPSPQADAIVEETISLANNPDRLHQFVIDGQKTAQAYDISVERQRFHDLLKEHARSV